MRNSELIINVIATVDLNVPTLQQLNAHVRRQAAVHWKDLGIELLDVDLISIIECNDSRDVERCCTNMFKLWLKTDTKASWENLVNALKSKSVGLIVLADEIERKFVTGMCMLIVLCTEVLYDIVYYIYYRIRQNPWAISI